MIAPTSTQTGVLRNQALLFHLDNGSWWAAYSSTIPIGSWAYEDQRNSWCCYAYWYSAVGYRMSYFTHTTRREFKYYTMMVGDAKIKKFYRIRITGTDLEVCQHTDETGTFRTPTAITETGFSGQQWAISSTYRRGKGMMLYLNDTDGTGSVDSIELIYREMLGKR